MQLIRLHTNTTQHVLEPTVLTIGNFDGVHLGHQAMIRQLKNIAVEKNLKTAVMIFEPQPLEFFCGDVAPPRLSSLREKIQCLNALGIDYVVVAKFEVQFRDLTATGFAEILKQQLHVQELVLGDDFHFGKNRQGDSQFLRDYGFAVTNLPTITYDSKRVSSTRIREVLVQGDLYEANALLGRPYQITGRVMHGNKIGRTLDFPTINVALHRHKPALNGIYAVEVSCLERDLPAYVCEANPNKKGIAGYQAGTLFGAASVGLRPSIAQDQPEWRLEVHFPDVAANLYGLLMQVTFLHYLHGERKYPSLDSLKKGIADDVVQLREYRAVQPYPF